MNFRKEKCRRRGAAPDACAGLRQACAGIADGEPLAFIDGYGDAIRGVAEVESEERVFHDQEKIVRELMRRDSMDSPGAVEFFEYNFAALSQGDGSPFFCVDGSERDG